MVLEFASPTYMGLSLSLAFVIWAAVGGRESIVAATLGGIGVNMAEGRLSDLFFDQWTLILGVIFIVVVLFLPRGLFGLVMDFREKLEDFYRNKTKASTASAMESNPVSAIDQGGDK